MYDLYFTNDARRDWKMVSKSTMKTVVENLLTIIKLNPYQNPPDYKKLKGKYHGAFSRRINLQHRLFYEIDEVEKRIKVLRMWSHYGDN